MHVILTSTALKLQHPSRRAITEKWIDRLADVRGISKSALYVGLERGCEEDAEIYERVISFMPVVFVPNSGNGPHSNNISVWQQAFDHGSKFFTFLENDVMAGPDLFEYMEWMRAKFKDDKGIFCINSYTGNEDSNRRYSYWRKPSLGVWGFGMWKDRAAECLKDYKDTGLDKIAQIGWDVHLNTVSNRRRAAIMPCYSRCINIGVEGIHSYVGNPELDETKRTWSGNDNEMLEECLQYYEIPPIDKREYIMGWNDAK